MPFFSVNGLTSNISKQAQTHTCVNKSWLKRHHLVTTLLLFIRSPDTPVVHASGSGQLRANPHVAGPWLSPGKSTRRAVTTMGSNDLVVGEDHMMGPSCQRYNWQTGKCGSIAFGSSPRRGKYPLVEKTSGDNLEEKSGVEPLKAVWC